MGTVLGVTSRRAVFEVPDVYEECLAVVEKTSTVSRVIAGQRRLVHRGVQAQHICWPEMGQDRHAVVVRGKPFVVGNNGMFRLLELLVMGPRRKGIGDRDKSDGIGPWIDYLDIAEYCLDKDDARPEAIRRLKRRLVEKLHKLGLPQLAQGIRGEKERYRLVLRGS